MLKGFRDFLMRGNVVELAIGIAIGVAFTTLVGEFGRYLINPIVALVGGNSAGGFSWQILSANDATVINFGALINALIVFAVTMAIIYFLVVVPMGKMAARMNAGKTPAEAPVPEDIVLLREIRDSLARR